MNQTPRANRLHIAIFGKRNVGKSSLINALTDQEIAIVSEVAGTTTDPVYKSMELLPIGPVLIIDTAGIDDIGDLGALRIEKTRSVLNKTDVALLVVHWERGIQQEEKQLIEMLKARNIPLLVVINQIDTSPKDYQPNFHQELPTVVVSAKTKAGIHQLKEKIIEIAPREQEQNLVDGLVEPGDHVLLITPIDSAAPKGRMILPQVQAIRAILDKGAYMTICKETELAQVVRELKSPISLAITDSQAFQQVSETLPMEIPLTSFSILYARQKGDIRELVKGVEGLKMLKPQDKVLIVEGCTHHQQKDDIGTVKIPRWLKNMAGGELQFHWLKGSAFQEDLRDYQLVVHCGSCMHNRKEMLYRINCAKTSGVPMVNYGILIAYVTGILDRAIAPLMKN